MIGFISSAILILIAVILFASLQNWKDYFSAMQEWGRFEVHEMAVIPNAIKPETPLVIEGQTNLRDARDFWQNNRSMQCIALWLFNVKLYSSELFGMFAAVFIALSSFIFFQWRKNKLVINDNKIFLFIFLLYILTEYFSPAPSYSYHYVQWIFPVLLLLASVTDIKLNIATVLIFLGLSMNLGAMSFVPYNLAIGEAILFTGVFIYTLRY